MSRVRSSLCFFAAVPAACSIAISGANAETLTFSNNAVPTGWSTWFFGPGRNLQFINNRMEIGQVDTYAGITRPLDASALAAVKVSFDGNIANVYWGQGLAAGVMRDTSNWYAGTAMASTGKYGFGVDATSMSLASYDASGGHSALSQFGPPKYGDYHVTASFLNRKASITVAPLNAPNSPLFQSGWVNLPGFTLQDMRNVVVWGVTTTGQSAWIDNINVSTVSMMPALSPSIFRDWTVVNQSTPATLKLDTTLSTLPVYAQVQIPKDRWNDAILVSTDWLKNHAGSIARGMEGISFAASVGSAIGDISDGSFDPLSAYALVSSFGHLTNTYEGNEMLVAIDETRGNIRSSVSAAKLAKVGKCGGGFINTCVGLAFSANALIWDEARAQWSQFGNDPVDHNYKVIVTLGDYEADVNAMFLTAATGQAKILRDQLLATAKASAILKAANQSMDKYAGAVEAGDAEAAAMQMSKVLDFVAAYNQVALDLTDLVSAARAVVASSGFGQSVDLTGLARMQDAIRSTGHLPQAVLDQFVKAGFTPEQIAAITAGILGLQPSLLERALSADQVGSGVTMQLYSVTAVPEPASALLLVLGLLLIGGVCRSAQRRAFIASA